MHVSLRQLRAFVAVAQSGSFTRAAQQVHLSQSAVSMVVRQLETEIGLPLFHRARKVVTLSEMGQHLLPIAVRMLEDLQQIAAGVTDTRLLRRGSLKVGVPELLACTMIPPVLAAFARRYPDIALKVADIGIDEIPGAVARSEVEVGIGPDRTADAGIERTFFIDVPIQLVCAASHPLARREALTWSDTRTEPWILYPSVFSQDIQAALTKHDRLQRFEDATSVGHLYTALALVGQGMGVTTAPDYARALGRDFELAFVPLHEPLIERVFYIYRRQGHTLSPAAEAFLALLAERTAPISGPPKSSPP
jgi:DNA-binding transcriptional LysR family regulator